MGQRTFFRTAVALRDKPPKPKRTPRKKIPAAAFSIVTVEDGSVRHMNNRYLARQLGASKSGNNFHGHRWNSETARKAINKYWKKQARFNKRIGCRIGRPSKRRKAIAYAPLRELYALSPREGIRYIPSSHTWWLTLHNRSVTLQERTALRRLGHLPRIHGFVPRIINGMKTALVRGEEE